MVQFIQRKAVPEANFIQCIGMLNPLYVDTNLLLNPRPSARLLGSRKLGVALEE